MSDILPILNLRIKTKCPHRISLQTNPIKTLLLLTSSRRLFTSSLYSLYYLRALNMPTSSTGSPMVSSSSSAVRNCLKILSSQSTSDIGMFIVLLDRYTLGDVVEYVWISEIKKGTGQIDLLAQLFFGRTRRFAAFGKEENKKWGKKWEPLEKFHS